MLIRKKSIHKLYLTVYIFLVIFAPPFLPKFRLIISLISLILIICSTPPISKLCKYAKKSGLYILISGICFFLLYIFFIMLINEIFFNDTVQLSHYTGLYNRFIVSILVIVPCSFYLNSKMDKYKFNIDDFWSIIFGAELIETFTVIMALLFPSVKKMFNHLALVMNGGELRENIWYTTVRSYGFAESLLDSFGFGAGLIAGLAFIYGVFKEKKYIYYSFLRLIASLVNARTGVIIYFMAIAVVLVSMLWELDVKKIITIMLGVSILIFGGTYLWNILETYYPATVGWISEGFGDLISIFTKQKNVSQTTGFIKVVQSASWWEMPVFPRWIIGTGHSRYLANGYAHTDFGYVNDIWAGGLIGCSVLYGSSVVFTLRQISEMKKKYKILMLYLLLVVFTYNIKSCTFTCSTGLTAYIIIVQYINYYFSNTTASKLTETIQYIHR